MPCPYRADTVLLDRYRTESLFYGRTAMPNQPQVFIANRSLTITVNPAYSLLNNYLMQRIPVQTLCGGKAACGRCRFRVLKDAAHLSPVRPAEIARLGETLIAAGWRLSCQSHALRGVTIELPEMDEELDDRPQPVF